MRQHSPSIIEGRVRAAQGGSGGLLLFALVAAEAAIVWLLAALVLISPDEPDAVLPPVSVFLVLYAAALLPRLLDAFDVWDPGYGLVMAVGVAATALLLIKVASFPQLGWSDSAWLDEAGDSLILRPTEARLPVWGLLVVVVYAWWRGRRRADPTLDGAYVQFRLGAPAILFAVVAHGVTGSPVAQRAVVGAVLVFFAASLVAIGAGRLSGIGPAGRSRFAIGARGRSLGMLLAPVGAVLVVGVVVAGLASRDLLDTMLWALAPLVWGLTVIVRVLVLVVALVAFVLVSPILWLISGKELRIRRVEPSEDRSFRDTLQREAERVADLPDALRYLLAVLILAAILSALTKFVLRRRRRPAATPDEDRASVFDPRGLLGALGTKLRALLGLLPHPGDDPLADLRGDRRWRHTIAIREIYADLLRRGAELGRPRPSGTTPAEHARRLRDLPGTSGAAGDLQILTERYNAARYGADPASAEAAATAREAWRRIERATRRG
jgi:hypothetical protein